MEPTALVANSSAATPLALEFASVGRNPLAAADTPFKFASEALAAAHVPRGNGAMKETNGDCATKNKASAARAACRSETRRRDTMLLGGQALASWTAKME
mmetsp:Transcript_122726/g.244133  ORF Transcript_122726/g.244133 Transcript_122726/m.244133 type:complete len:100 (-) Transcript_122726:5-304(-)